MTERPTLGWIQDNFKKKSAAIRYLSREYKMNVKEISSLLCVPYRQVFGVIARMNKAPCVDDICPVCRRRNV